MALIIDPEIAAQIEVPDGAAPGEEVAIEATFLVGDDGSLTLASAGGVPLLEGEEPAAEEEAYAEGEEAGAEEEAAAEEMAPGGGIAPPQDFNQFLAEEMQRRAAR